MTGDEYRKEADMGIPRKMPIGELVKLLVKAGYEKSLPPQKKAIIIKAGQEYGLIDGQERRTAKFFALVNDEVEQLARELTGHSKRPERPCRCGCGKPVRGKALYATTRCRKRMSRWTQPEEVGDVTVKPNSGLQVIDNTTEKIGQNAG